MPVLASFMQDGIRHHHIICPKTGQAIRSIRSVTIIGENATITDVLSTTIFILGVEKGMKLISSLKGIDAIIIDRNARTYYSTGLTKPSPLKK